MSNNENFGKEKISHYLNQFVSFLCVKNSCTLANIHQTNHDVSIMSDLVQEATGFSATCMLARLSSDSSFVCLTHYAILSYEKAAVSN